MNQIHRLLLIQVALLVSYSGITFAQSTLPGTLRVGAAKVDITPTKQELPASFLGVNDPIFSRAIVIDNGQEEIALVTVDIGGIADKTINSLVQKIGQDVKIPAKNILITATHTHSVPFGYSGDALEEKIINSIKAAKQKLQPARIGYGTGVSYLNVNRNLFDQKTHRWREGPDYEGISDKTVAVISFETLQGQPIAVYYNYAMHGVTMGMSDMVSGDAPGATSKYIEDTFDDAMVAVWSTGACGDQNPVYYQQTYDLREMRIREYATRGEDISNAMPPGGKGLDRTNPAVQKLMNQQKQLIASMGQFLGEEVMHVMRGMDRKETKARLYANQKTITLPGRKRLDTGRAGYAGTYADADSIPLKLGLVVIDDIALAWVNGEVFSAIGQRLKKESPYGHTMMVTLTNGFARSGYIPSDVAFSNYTFEVLSSSLMPGYAESGIVNGILDLMEDSKVKR